MLFFSIALPGHNKSMSITPIFFGGKAMSHLDKAMWFIGGWAVAAIFYWMV